MAGESSLCPPMAKLVVAGRRGVGRRTLMCRIPGVHASPLPSVAETEDPGVWRIETKYFTVDVRVCYAEAPGDVPLDGGPCEGIILVFDMTDGDSFTFLERWQPFLEERNVEVGICAGNKADLVGEPARAEGRPLWTNWSLDHQLEFCECSAIADVFTGSRDAEGVERVVEALGSHTWSGFAKKPLPHTPHPALGPAVTAISPAAPLHAPDALEMAAQRAFDTSKWDRYVAEQPDTEAEAEAQEELSKLRLEKTCYDGELPVDEDVFQLVESARLSDDEVSVITQLLEATQRPDFAPHKFFQDPSALHSYLPGPNSSLHLNLDSILVGASRVIQDLVQVYRENPAASRLLVRSAIWSNMVDAATMHEEGPVGAVPVLVPLALVWSVLESCAAETPGKFWARISSAASELASFLEQTTAPAIVRCMHPGVRRSDYVQQLLEAAHREKEAGNINFKQANTYFATQHYAAALKILEQFWIHDSMCVAAARDIAVACHLNTAACALKDGGDGSAEDAAQHCNTALALAPNNAKAYFRRGLAMLSSRSCDMLPPPPPHPGAEGGAAAHRSGGGGAVGRGGGSKGGAGAWSKEDENEMMAAAAKAVAAVRGKEKLHGEVLTKEQEEEKMKKESEHLPPRNVLVTW